MRPGRDGLRASNREAEGRMEQGSAAASILRCGAIRPIGQSVRPMTPAPCGAAARRCPRGRGRPVAPIADGRGSVEYELSKRPGGPSPSALRVAPLITSGGAIP